MMNNSSPTSDCQRPISENVTQDMQQQPQQQEERVRMKEEAETSEQTTITTNIESRKKNEDREMITRMENAAASTTTDKIINENSVSSESPSRQSDVEKKSSKDHGGTINLMQDEKESENNHEKLRMRSDGTEVSSTWTILNRGRGKNSVCWTILCGSREQRIRRKSSKRKSRSEIKIVADSTFELRKNPVPTKEWVWIYRRPLIRQNAFCDTWPEN